MIKEIVKDDFFLKQKSSPATKDDLYIANDLLDTVEFHKQHCVGMAANMIGYLKNIIVFLDDNHYTIMINPTVIKLSGKQYLVNEGCLSHDDTKETKRFEKIKVSYLDINMKKKIKTYEGFTAQIIQHELDHLEGILI